jgi:mannose-1-phosphate guanylyltransferase
MYGLYKQFAPEIYAHTEAIMKTEGTEHYTATLKEHYEAMPSIHFDHAIVEKIDPATAYVMTVDIGWTDIGAWESLKNALEENQKDNVTNGRVLLKDCEDTLIYNYDEKKLIVCMDLEDFIVINTNDVLLVTKKGSVPKITDLVKSLEGTEHEDLT